MQFVHKLVRVGAQGIDVIHHAVDALHQLADFGFVAEGGDGAYHPLPAFTGTMLHSSSRPLQLIS